MFLKVHTWLTPHVWKMRADVESTRHHGGQLDRSTCGRPNFCIRTLIEAIFGLLERSRSVEWQTKYWSISDQTFSAVCLILSCSASMSPLILGGLDGMKMLLGLLEPILKLAGSLCSYRGCYWILRRMRSLPIQALLGGKKTRPNSDQKASSHEWLNMSIFCVLSRDQ